MKKYTELFRRIMDCNSKEEYANIRDDMEKAYTDGEITMGQRCLLIMHLNRLGVNMRGKYTELFRRILNCTNKKECDGIFAEITEAHANSSITMAEQCMLLRYLNEKESEYDQT